MISGQSSRRPSRALSVAVPLLAALLLCGCGESLRYSPSLHYPAHTDPIVDEVPKDQPWASEQPGRLDESIAEIPKKGGKITDPKTIDAGLRAKLHTALDAAFGTPYDPRVGAAKGEDEGVVTQLVQLKVRDASEGAPFHTLATGSKAFRFHCVHCHGLPGDGRGPTGPWVVPHPRDYRLGKFKFVSSAGGPPGKPRRDDLLRTLHQGIDGTSMPSFALLTDEELDGLASYVIHLSIRGEVEKDILTDLTAGYDYPDMDGEVLTRMTEIVGQWAAADAKPIEPAKGSYTDFTSKQMAESIRRGYKLFSDPSGSASCIGCHQDYGRQVPFRYDKWGTLVRPMNLTLGLYRGGRRPIDIFWRIKRGIDPSGMPPTGVTDDKDVWDVVNFVQALPYPLMLPEDVRYKIYDRPPEEHAEKSANHVATEVTVNTERKN